MELTHHLRSVIRRMGVDVVRYPSRRQPAYRRVQLLHHHAVDCVIDVGANRGQYATELRRYGYRGRIVSFEPMQAAFKTLRTQADNDDEWEAVPVALGAKEGMAVLNISANSISSSLLPMLDRHAAAAPRSRYVDTESVRVCRLDDLYDRYVRSSRAFLKMDTQGYERDVLAGAEASLSRCLGLQMEMSLVPLYEGQMLFPEALASVADRGYSLALVEPGFTDRNGRMLQLDGVFFRTG